MSQDEQSSVSDAHRFRRDRRGMVKFRINLSAEEADIIEQGAMLDRAIPGGVSLPSFMRTAILDRARANISRDAG